MSYCGCQYTPEQRLRFKEIEMATDQKLRKCCGVAYDGKEREIALQEQHNKELLACNLRRIRETTCCCRQGSSI